jgi:hypothetical protein
LHPHLNFRLGRSVHGISRCGAVGGWFIYYALSLAAQEGHLSLGRREEFEECRAKKLCRSFYGYRLWVVGLELASGKDRNISI